MNFIWTEFGKLVDFDDGVIDPKYLFIFNENQENRKISIQKYGASVEIIRQKINALLDKNIQIRTSQNTGAWSTEEWFSDLSLSNTPVKDSGGSIGDETIEELLEKLSLAEDKAKEASQRAEDIAFKYNQLVIDNIELQRLADEQTYVERDENAEYAEIFDQMIGDTIEFQIKGHAQRTLALRMGIEHHGRLDLKIIEKIKNNYYRVLITRQDISAIMALGFKKQTYFVKSVEWPSSEMRNQFSRKYDETKIKSDANYTLDDLIGFHKKIFNNL
jgi:hypothetical protein